MSTVTIHQATVQLADSDRGLYTELRVTLARHPSETAERLVTRLLAYALFYEEGLVFTRGLSDGDLPDLWLHDPTGALVLWLEVGLPDAARILKARRRAQRVMLLVAGRNLRLWQNTQLPQLQDTPGIGVWTVDAAVIQRLVAALERNIQWSVTVSGGVAYIAVGATTLETPVTCLAGAPPASR
jgi:uncharacterized protein YaeQ